MRWTVATGMQTLGGTGSVAAAITFDGSVAMGTDIPDGYFHATRWISPANLQYLSVLTGADSAEVYAMSADGSMAAGYSGDQFNGTYSYAVRWTGLPGSGVIQSLGVLGDGVFSHADAMNADGSVVGGASTLPLPAGDHAFLWTPALGMVDLNTYLPSLGLALTGWTLTDVRGISADGSAIVGYGTLNGADRAFLVTGIPVPPPHPCYANCDASTATPALNVNDFQCFLNKFAGQDAYANCDASTAPPTLNVNDFQCFVNAFAAGCP
jgi:probable HAF family extracellular repeat protein